MCVANGGMPLSMSRKFVGVAALQVATITCKSSANFLSLTLTHLIKALTSLILIDDNCREVVAFESYARHLSKEVYL